MKAFFNTTNLSGNKLREAVMKAKTQNEAVLTYMINKQEPFSASQLFGKFQSVGKRWPLTSVRRSLSSLSAKKNSVPDLVKTDEMVIGLYGEPEHKYALNREKYPVQTVEQKTLFA